MIFTNIGVPVPTVVYERKINALVWLAAIIAGTLWISHYMLQLCFGLMTGSVLFEQQGAVLWRLDAVAFLGAYLCTGLALVGFTGPTGGSLAHRHHRQ